MISPPINPFSLGPIIAIQAVTLGLGLPFLLWGITNWRKSRRRALLDAIHQIVAQSNLRVSLIQDELELNQQLAALNCWIIPTINTRWRH